MAIETRYINVLAPSTLNVHASAYSGDMSGLSVTLDTSNPAGTRYLIAFDFEAGNSNRGQMHANGKLIFDSYSTGAGTNRITAGWDEATTTAGGKVTSYISITGSGNLRISKNLKVYFVQIDEGV